MGIKSLLKASTYYIQGFRPVATLSERGGAAKEDCFVASLSIKSL